MIEVPDGSGLVLDTRSHRYFYDGLPVGGVSEIIQALGIVDPRWFDSYSAERGTAVHTALELLAHGTLDWATVDPRIAGYVRAGERFLLDARVPIGSDAILTEHLVFHPGFRYAGKLDLFAPVFGEPAVVDFKSGGLGCANIQTAAYEDALRLELGNQPPMRRMAVQLRDDGSYRKEDFRAASDYATWAACCHIFNTYHIKNRKD